AAGSPLPPASISPTSSAGVSIQPPNARPRRIRRGPWHSATIARGKARLQGAGRHAVDSKDENPDLAGPGSQILGGLAVAALGDGTHAGTHQADAGEIGLLAGAFLGAFAGLVALVQELDLLELLEGFAERSLGFLELA